MFTHSSLFSPLQSWPSDEACTSGQLVVASRESQYKVFHFHHGGLDKLADVFQQWKYCAETHLKDQVAQRMVGAAQGAGEVPPWRHLVLSPSPLLHGGPGLLGGTSVSSWAQASWGVTVVTSG